MSMKVTYRTIAIVMAKKVLTASDDGFNSKVKDYIEAMERLPLSQQLAIKAAYIFASISPLGIQDDCFQDFYLAVDKKNTNSEALAYTIAKRRWQDMLEKRYGRKKKDGHKGLLNGACFSFSHSFGGNVGYNQISSIESVIDADRVWQILPSKIKHIVLKRLNKQALTEVERQRLSRYNKHHSHMVRELVKVK